MKHRESDPGRDPDDGKVYFQGDAASEQDHSGHTPADMLQDWQPAEQVVGRAKMTPDALFEENPSADPRSAAQADFPRPTPTDATWKDVYNSVDAYDGNGAAGDQPTDGYDRAAVDGPPTDANGGPVDYSGSYAAPADYPTGSAPAGADQAAAAEPETLNYGGPVYTYSPSDEGDRPELLEENYIPPYAPSGTEQQARTAGPAADLRGGTAVPPQADPAAAQLPFYDYADMDVTDGHGGLNVSRELRHLKEALRTLWAILRGFFTDRPMQSLKPAAQSENLYVWVIISLAVIFLGALGGFSPNPYVEFSYGKFYAKSLLQMLISLLLPAIFYSLVKLFKRSDLKINSLLNVVAVTVLPIMVFRLVSMIFARLLPLLVVPLVQTGSLVHIFMLHRALKQERFGKSRGYYWFVLLYVFVYLLVMQLLVPVA